MKEMVLTLCILGCIGLFFAVVVIAADKWWSFYYTRQDNKRRSEHPYLYQLFDECNNKGNESIRWYNNEIAPRKKEVDNILKEIDYLPNEQRVKKEAELEEIRNRIYLAEITHKVLNEELQEIRDKIRKYVADNNLEWAKKWGW